MRPFYCTLLMCLCTACNSGKAGNGTSLEMPADTLTTFVFPSIPPLLESPEARTEYLVNHYWDHTDFADTNYVHHPEITEQAWVDYIDLLKRVSPQTADASLKALLTKAEKEPRCYHYLTGLADKYLYDPNSPMRNEEFYISVLDVQLSSTLLDETEKIRPQARRQLAQRNRLGTPATDFTYTLANGKTGTLYAIKAPYTLLFINNPGCHACAETIEALRHAPNINRIMKTGGLVLLSLYPDEEMDEWKNHLSDFPKEWINSYDRKLVIKEKNLYDLKAIPTLYLLDEKKVVLLKDATAEEVENYLSSTL